MARKLRIAASVFFGMLTVALVVLWVRSYWRSDVIAHSVAGGPYDEIESVCGFIVASRTTAPHELPSFWGHRSSVLSDLYSSSRSGFRWNSHRLPSYAYFPHWFAVTATAVPAILCWIPMSLSFSLRTLLIATTLFAVALGLGVWLAS